MNTQISKYVCWLGHFFDEPEIFENKEIYMVACPVCHSETIHVNIAHLTQLAIDPASAAPTPSKFRGQYLDQPAGSKSNTPGK